MRHLHHRGGGEMEPTHRRVERQVIVRDVGLGLDLPRDHDLDLIDTILTDITLIVIIINIRVTEGGTAETNRPDVEIATVIDHVIDATKFISLKGRDIHHRRLPLLILGQNHPHLHHLHLIIVTIIVDQVVVDTSGGAADHAKVEVTEVLQRGHPMFRVLVKMSKRVEQSLKNDQRHQKKSA